MARVKKFKLNFFIPKIYGAYYDPAKQEAYFFALNSTEYQQKLTEEIEDFINHEYLHYLIQKISTEEACYEFDKIASKVFEWDREIYQLLY